MTYTRTQWECDRCGARQQHEPNEEPVQWVQLRIFKLGLPKANAAEDLGDFCRDCRESLNRWVAGLDIPMLGTEKVDVSA